jgi:hypothetical protein
MSSFQHLSPGGDSIEYDFDIENGSAYDTDLDFHSTVDTDSSYSPGSESSKYSDESLNSDSDGSEEEDRDEKGRLRALASEITSTFHLELRNISEEERTKLHEVRDNSYH